MGFKAIISLAAQNDITDAIEWYELQKINLGKRFYVEFTNTLNYIIKNPLLFPLKLHGYREATVSVFPFIVVYEILDDIIIINAVFNTSKNPVKKSKKL